MRVGIVTDVHEDIVRLREALAVLDARGCQELMCLGDAVGFAVPYFAHFGTRDASAVLAVLRERCAAVVAGNHDLFAVRKLPEHRAGVEYPEDWYARPYSVRERMLRGRVFLYEREELSPLLDPGDVAYVRGLPEFVVRQYGGLRVLYSHYAYPDLAGTTPFEPAAPADASAHFAFMARHACTLGVSGHDHSEGFRVFTTDAAKALPFGTLRLDDAPTWLHGPAVANGTRANGVMVLDTDARELEAIPLGTPRHQLPEWRGPWKG